MHCQSSLILLHKIAFQPFWLDLTVNFIKSWIYSNSMEIGFYSNKKKIDKNNYKRYDLNLRPSSNKHDALASMAIGNLQIWVQYLIYLGEFQCTLS